MTFSEPKYVDNDITKPDESIIKLANDLKLEKHPNGGFFKETYRSEKVIEDHKLTTAINFIMTCESSIGKFHTNKKSTTIHILQGGRGKYILIKENGEIEEFIVGFDLEKGEKTQWIVEPGTYKGCYIMPINGEEISSKDYLWVSEIVIPGFEFSDMKFLDNEALISKIGMEKGEKLAFLL